MTARCIDNPQLFESTSMEDHADAKIHCLGRRRPDGSQITPACPFLGECRRILDQTLLDWPKGPQGTWAGKFVVAAGPQEDPPGRDHARIADEEAIYSVDDARKARTAYKRGERTPWVIAGNRTYKRRQGQQARDQRAGAA
jgi:hypothetical protein